MNRLHVLQHGKVGADVVLLVSSMTCRSKPKEDAFTASDTEEIFVATKLFRILQFLLYK